MTWRTDDGVDFAHRYGQSATMIEQLTEALADRCRTLFAPRRPKAKVSQPPSVKCLTT
jgi:hypothetical protein